MNNPAPYWARWQAKRVDASPWATVTLRGAHGPVSARLMSIGRGWLSVLHQNRAEVWPPARVDGGGPSSISCHHFAIIHGSRGIRGCVPKTQILLLYASLESSWPPPISTPIFSVRYNIMRP